MEVKGVEDKCRLKNPEIMRENRICRKDIGEEEMNNW